MGLSCLVAGAAFAQPAYINYQGTLTDSAGQPMATGTYTLEFNIYDDATGTDPANLIWGPMIFDGATATGHGASVTVINGRFNVILGPVDTSDRSIRDAFLGDIRFIEIKVDGGAPILPRQQFLSTPYSFGMIPRGAIIMWSGSEIPPGWALCDGQNGTPDLRDKFVRGAAGLGPYVEAGSDTHIHTSPEHLHSVNPPSTTSGGDSGSGFTAGNSFVSQKASPDGHTHSVNIGAFNSASTTVTIDPSSNLPRHFALAFLMKL